MKKIFPLLFISSILLTSCGIDEAEKVADEIHEKMDTHDYTHIIDNLCDEDLVNMEGPEGLMDFFLLVESWGKVTSRTKDMGFNQSTKNGTTTVKLNYTLENDMGIMYEGLVLVNRGSGYKLLTIVLNTKKSEVDRQLEGY